MNIPRLLQHSMALHRSSRASATVREQSKKRQLEKLLHHVFEHSAFYRSHYERHGIFSRHIGKISLTDLPPVDKKILLDNFDEAVCDKELKLDDVQKFMLDPANREKTYKGKYSIVHTSGTTGSPGVFVYGPREVCLISAVMFTRINKIMIKPKRTRLMMLAAIEGKYASVAVCDHAPKWIYDLKKCSVNQPRDTIAQNAQTFQPHVLGGYASAIHMLAQDQLSGRIRINPRSIVCSGEPMTELARRDMIEAFGIQPINFYASSESLAMAAECTEHNKMHLFDDLQYFEAVHDDLSPVDDGQVGDLLLTNLYNYTRPLIRYRTSDRIAKGIGTCRCGSSLPLVDKLVGRSEEYLWFDAGQNQQEFIHPITFAELYAPGLERFRVLQTSQQSFTIQAQTKQRQSVEDELKRQLDFVLETKGLQDNVRYSFDFVDQIPNVSRSGKFDLVLPLHRTKEIAASLRASELNLQ